MPAVAPPDLDTLSDAIAASWSAETCDPSDLEDWHEGNPSRGQCGVSALVINDYLGGDLLLARVSVDGVERSFHYWNRLPDGHEVDLTRAQFLPNESVGEPWGSSARRGRCAAAPSSTRCCASALPR